MKLQIGDIVDIIAPSSVPKDNQWEKGLSILQSWGLKSRMAKGAIKPWLFHSNSNKKRSFFLNKAFFNKSSSAIWMLRGGYGLQKLMPSFIKSYSKNTKKKLFIGYSDGTALHLYLNSKNQKTLHAPLICELPVLSQRELWFLKNILFGVHEEITFKRLSLLKKTSKRILKAPITGGNLSLLSSSVGTAGFSNLQSHFLFIEDVNEEDYKIDRMLHHLFYSGALKGVKALLFGHFHPLSQNALKTKILKNFSDICNIPIILGMPCGHEKVHYPLPFKSPAELTIQGDKAELKIKWLDPK